MRKLLFRIVPLLLVTSLGLSLLLGSRAAPGPETNLDALEQRIQGMQRRLRQLQDREAIENLISIYGYYLDKALWDQVTDLFAEDGVIELSQRGRYLGKARIRASLELLSPQGVQTGNLRNHIQVQPVIHISADGKRAWSRHRAISQLGGYGAASFLSGGVYENEYVKEDGVWKIQRDQVFTTFFTTYPDGWFTGLGPAAAVSPEFPPDLPPSVNYQALPEVYIPAFHYRHPVTGRPVGKDVAAPVAR